MSLIVQIMSSDTVPRRISAYTLIASGIETAPTKRSATAKLAIRMLEFVCNPLIFLTDTITKMLKRVVNGQAAAVMVIAS